MVKEKHSLGDSVAFYTAVVIYFAGVTALFVALGWLGVRIEQLTRMEL